MTTILSSLSKKSRWKQIIKNCNIHTVVMIRHGESLWNVENRFTGWCDVPLTKNGQADAFDAGRLMGARGLKFDVAFTSKLERAWRTCALALAASGQNNVETIRSTKLNERHYGALQGHQKDCPILVKAFGENQVMEWRRSYHSAPPSLYDLSFHSKLRPFGCVRNGLKTSTEKMDDNLIDYKLYNSTRKQLSEELGFNDYDENEMLSCCGGPTSTGTPCAQSQASNWPSTESLQECQQRAFGYWQEVIAPRVLKGDRVLIVAHANTIRALVKAIDGIEDVAIAKLKIPNGVPLVYTMDHNLRPIDDISDDIGFQAKYLVSAHNHSRMMRYENSMRKKLRSLFEYLDVDNDGRITPECLRAGLTRLQNIASIAEVTEAADMASPTSTRSNRVKLDLDLPKAGENPAHDSDDEEDELINPYSNMSSINSFASSRKIIEINKSIGSKSKSTTVPIKASSWTEADTLLDNSTISDGNSVSLEHLNAMVQSKSDGVYELDNTGSPSIIQQDMGDLREYEVEELIRCVPEADDNGGITLDAFLAAESSIIGGLTQMKLLQ